MSTPRAVFVLVLFLASIVAAGCTGAPSPAGVPTPVSPAELRTVVEDATALAAARGDAAAIAVFDTDDLSGGQRLFAFDRNGSLLTSPNRATPPGPDRSNWSDPRGLPLVRVAGAVIADGGGFVAYVDTAPANGTGVPGAPDAYVPMIAYVAPAGERLWLGASVPLDTMDAGGAVPAMVDLVERCAQYGRTEERDTTLAAISDRSGPFVDAAGHYVYAYDTDGTLLAHPYLPGKVGTSLAERRDAFGMQNIRALAETARQGGGYVVFIWPNPDHERREEPMTGYVLPVDDAWWVGSGVYLGEVTDAGAAVPAPAS
jgi:signal transduction histidine kinase